VSRESADPERLLTALDRTRGFEDLSLRLFHQEESLRRRPSSREDNIQLFWVMHKVGQGACGQSDEKPLQWNVLSRIVVLESVPKPSSFPGEVPASS
jgi:hypothetical protein